MFGRADGDRMVLPARGVLLWWVVALLVAACSGESGGQETTTTQAGDQETTTTGEAGETSFEGTLLRIGSSSIPDFTDVSVIRMIQQLREEHGIDVEVSYFEGDQPPLRALVAGELDVAATGVPATLHLAEQTDEAVKVFGVNLQATDYILVSQPELTELDDLVGKQLGTASPGGISDVLSRMVLDAEGIDLDEVEFVSVGGTSARISALASGQIDAGPAHAADALNAMEESGLNRLWLYADSVQDYLQQGLVSTDVWLAENPELAQLVVDELIEASRWAAENKEEYIALSNDEVSGPTESIREQAYDIFNEIGMFAVDGGLAENQLRSTAEVEVELGNISEVPPLEAWTDPSFVEDILSREGEAGQ